MTRKKWLIHWANRTPHPSCEGEDACYGNIMDFLVCKGGADREEFIVHRYMKSQCLTNECSTINSLSLGGNRGRYVHEHVVKPM